MEFFLLFLLNIFTGTVIYLILSLKMERTSSTFQEQKLRKEMGEIITEFNSTAERNITLLENRISILKKLLNEKSSFKGVDFIIEDEIIPDKISAESKKRKTAIEEIPAISAKNIQHQNKQSDTNPGSVKNDSSLLVGFIDKISLLNREESSSNEISKVKSGLSSSGESENVESAVDTGINDKAETVDDRLKAYEKKSEEEDLALLFSSSGNKYSLITELYSKGHSVDDISKYSGLPSGEIRLVISLNS